MSIRQPPRRLGAFFALLASVLLILSLVLPLFVATLSMPDSGIHEMTTKVFAWGFTDDRPKMSDGSLSRDLLPAHAVPMLFATLMLVVATVIAFVRAGSAGGRSATLWLTAAAAFAAGVAVTVVPQVTTWLAFYSPLFPEEEMSAGSGAYIGLGFWSLAIGAVLAVVSAALTAMPVRKPEAEAAEAPPADVEPTGAV